VYKERSKRNWKVTTSYEVMRKFFKEHKAILCDNNQYFSFIGKISVPFHQRIDSLAYNWWNNRWLTYGEKSDIRILAVLIEDLEQQYVCGNSRMSYLRQETEVPLEFDER